MEQTRVDPTEAKLNLRQLVEEIRLTPRDGMLAIDWKRNLEAGLAAVFPVDFEGIPFWLRGPEAKAICLSGLPLSRPEVSLQHAARTRTGGRPSSWTASGSPKRSGAGMTLADVGLAEEVVVSAEEIRERQKSRRSSERQY